MNNMDAIGGFLGLVYVGCVIGIAIYLITLVSRFVRAHERMAGALDNIARKFRDDGK
jgi:hypothetical protein